ncbi:hypothetical protein HS088_TW03G00027 [Tripterygium wilfordii]|uniref:Uncharacterized protein n=1 Tax=Tripterygium wilfordii TaxID=458696 RepID=A0A7J7DTJ8_TRIWF|nr:uncharacterized protein LOC119992621 [Tripterygium wilfordii]KAF5749702.1 hypothetical protein HS088_TW03G00027 [Tripterygium wilfordii]
MASITTTTTTITLNGVARPPKNRLACFSFAAYAKSLIDHLQSLNIPLLPGLTDEEFSAVEYSFNLSFPPDIRSILREGLPVGPHFPNWRSSSEQQLRILIDLPRLNLLRNISTNSFWVDSWGEKPEIIEEAVNKARLFIDKAPLLVPVYRNCYIPCTPNVSGSPVFYVDDREVRVISYDVTRFFQEIELGVFRSVALGKRFKTDAPAWAATTAKRIEFWTEVAERGRRVVARAPTHGWWIEGDLGPCLEEVFWRLRDGGWGEEDVREMMMIMDGSDEGKRGVVEGVSVELDVRILAIVLLRGGWSMEDVVYSLDLDDDEYPNSCSRENNSSDYQIISGINQLTQFQSLEV